MTAENKKSSDYIVVQRTIRDRRTSKVLAQVESPVAFDSMTVELMDRQVREALEVAAWAPFHFDRKLDGISQPWRCHILWHETCRTLANNFSEYFQDVKPNNKMPAMLSACGALVLVSWIPQTDVPDNPAKLQQINEEHLAATAALVQNLLLLLTAHGMQTYWSSGGPLRSREGFEVLGIDLRERLLAAVFVQYQHDQLVEEIPGKLREKRAASERWVREVEDLKSEI